MFVDFFKYRLSTTQTSSRVIWEEQRRYPHVRECVLPLYVLVVKCATLWNCYGTLWEPYNAVAERYRAIENAIEALQKRYGVLWNVMEHYSLQSVAGRYRKLCKRYGLTKRRRDDGQCGRLIVRPVVQYQYTDISIRL